MGWLAELKALLAGAEEDKSEEVERFTREEVLQQLAEELKAEQEAEKAKVEGEGVPTSVQPETPPESVPVQPEPAPEKPAEVVRVANMPTNTKISQPVWSSEKGFREGLSREERLKYYQENKETILKDMGVTDLIGLMENPADAVRNI